MRFFYLYGRRVLPCGRWSVRPHPGHTVGESEKNNEELSLHRGLRALTGASL